MVKRNESAAKPLNYYRYGERSQTISKESTPNDNGGSGGLLTGNTEDEDIVESKSKKFFERSVEKHGLKYNYDKVVYINAKTKVIIGCPIHGYFEQTPDKHLNSKYCCPLCFNLKRNTGEYLKNIKRKNGRLTTFDKYEKKVFKKYGQIKFSVVGEWLGIIKTIISVSCNKHGLTNVNARNLIQPSRRYSCQICSTENRLINKTDTPNNIISELKLLFGGNYSYVFPKDYKTKRDVINITCIKHGTFKRSVQKLLSGRYCSKCRIDKLIKDNILVGGYCEELFNNNPKLKDVDGLLYYLEINGGELYKIGITKNLDTDNRVKSLKSKSRGLIKDIREIKMKKMSLYDAFNLEQKILNENKELRTIRTWSTELFKKDISEHILHYFT